MVAGKKKERYVVIVIVDKMMSELGYGSNLDTQDVYLVKTHLTDDQLEKLVMETIDEIENWTDEDLIAQGIDPRKYDPIDPPVTKRAIELLEERGLIKEVKNYSVCGLEI